MAKAENRKTDDKKPLSFIGKLNFPHDNHTSAFGVKCKDCHHEISARKITIPHENYFTDFWINCKICHNAPRNVQGEQKCLNCHKTAMKNSADETMSSKVVIHVTCWKCHEVGKGQTASANCKKCHIS
jgi:hypothetical protein